MNGLELSLDTWIISDTHFLHKNIVKYCGRPEDHNEQMIDNWNAVVQPDDTVFHLGDLFMGNASRAAGLLKALPGRKYMLRGNHDKHGAHWYLGAGFTMVSGVARSGDVLLNKFLWQEPESDKWVMFSHYPDVNWLDQWDINVHGHIHNNGHSPDTPHRDYRNVSVEVIGYKPVRLRDVLFGNAYEGRRDRHDWDAQTRHDAERKGGPKIVLPNEREVGYYGSEE